MACCDQMLIVCFSTAPRSQVVLLVLFGWRMRRRRVENHHPSPCPQHCSCMGTPHHICLPPAESSPLPPSVYTLPPRAGLIAQQQCVGPLQIPVADCAVMAQSHQDLSGAATSIGEAPIKGLLNPAAMARLAMGEALTNLCFAGATGLADIKASVNWMYAAKMKSEGAAMYEAACALRWVGGRAGLGRRGAGVSWVWVGSGGGVRLLVLCFLANQHMLCHHRLEYDKAAAS